MSKFIKAHSEHDSQITWLNLDRITSIKVDTASRKGSVILRIENFETATKTHRSYVVDDVEYVGKMINYLNNQDFGS